MDQHTGVAREGFAIACSADGTELLAGDGDAVYTSDEDSGDHLEQPKTLAGVQVLAVSANGNALYVSRFGEIFPSRRIQDCPIASFISAIGRHHNGLSSCQFITCSADGSKLLVAIGSEQIGAVSSPLFASGDFGNTWSSNTALITNWRCAPHVPADGGKWFAATYSGAILHLNKLWRVVDTPIHHKSGIGYPLASSLTGPNWSRAVGFQPGTWRDLLRLPIQAQIWRTSLLLRNKFGWVSVASSADGSRLVAAADGGEIIFSSANSGGTWSTNNAPRLHWNTVCMAADGAKAFFAGNPRARAATATAVTVRLPLHRSPEITASLLGSNLVLAWPVPSTNFALQSCPDLRLGNWQGLTNNTAALNCSQFAK